MIKPPPSVMSSACHRAVVIRVALLLRNPNTLTRNSIAAGPFSYSEHRDDATIGHEPRLSFRRRAPLPRSPCPRCVRRAPTSCRPLSAQGRNQARELGERLRAEGASPEVVLTSPLLRARETGAELARALDAETEPDERLEPGASLEDIRAAVEGRGEHVIVVGHQPDCSQIAAALTGSEPAFPPAGLAVLELD